MRFRQSLYRWGLLLAWLSLVISVFPTSLQASNHTETRLSGQYESAFSGTTIWLRICGNGPKYRFRSTRIHDNAILWDQTYDVAVNGCTPFAYRSIIGAQTGEEFRFYSMVLDQPVNDADFLQRARRHVCYVNNGATGSISCHQEVVSAPQAAIETPTHNQGLTDSVTIRGWFVDLAAVANSGINQVSITLINQEASYTLGNATYGLARPDIATQLGDSRFTNAGYELTFDTRAYPNGSYTLQVAGYSTMNNSWMQIEQPIVIDNNYPPHQPPLQTPNNGAILNDYAVNFSWLDAGDPDNRPWPYREFMLKVTNSDQSWEHITDWQTATSAQLNLPYDGTYQWQVQARDGHLLSGWSNPWHLTIDQQTNVVHSDTMLTGRAEWDGTTIFLKVCGQGSKYRFRSVDVDTSTVLWDRTYTGLTGCSPNYRAVINGQIGQQFRFNSSVFNGNIADGDFLARARQDTCMIVGRGIIDCQQGATPPVAAIHEATQIQAVVEHQATTVKSSVCGQGRYYRIRAELLEPQRQLVDHTASLFERCSTPESVAARLQPGTTFRLYSTVINQALTDQEFMANARRDSCRVDGLGQIRCLSGNLPPASLEQQDSYTTTSRLPGFDTCAAPALATMRIWSRHSPYRNIGIYIGGSARACAQPNLTADWVNQTSQLGWNFMPIWVGPQAPCSNFRSRMSAEPSAARNQGIAEANAALNAAQQLGLTNLAKAKGIIYYDLEAYPTNNPSCRAAVRAFIDGWVSQLQARANKAGVYGSACGSAASDWAQNSYKPDAVWIAAWNRPSYDAQMGVTNLPCVANHLWPNQQRIRQYTGGHRETWGGVTLNIDVNALDGIVATAQANYATLNHKHKLQSEPSITLIQDPFELRSIRLVAPNQGWIIRNQQLQWTDDNARTWRTITPAWSNQIIHQVAFSDSVHGWIVSSPNPDDSAGAINLWQTADAGQTWQTHVITTINDLVSQGMPTLHDLTMLDRNQGWMTLKYASSSNFSYGVLLKTSDAGTTWQAYPLPVAGTVTMVDASQGWLIAHPTNAQLYRTIDGGVTWQPHSSIGTVEPQAQLYIAEIKQLDTGELALVVIETTDQKHTISLRISSDAGLTWHGTQSMTLDQPFDSIDQLPIEIVSAQQWLIGAPVLANSLPAQLYDLDFIDQDHGWAYTRNGECDGLRCAVETELWTSQDGGLTWELIDLPAQHVYLPTILR
ncbi:glycoside hydrolase domain-containing protein [Herpetosiphon gulosus]|uniref:Rv2525c-like glycoside hydrolase-like domain-containing protein n=1 Tax=Herpetosiphon gulosus TaxID=1973496 RepID=A0ABP9X484_9CHLR